MQNVRNVMGPEDLMSDLQQLYPAQLGTPAAVAASLCSLAQAGQRRAGATDPARPAAEESAVYAGMGGSACSFKRSRDIYNMYGGPVPSLPKPPQLMPLDRRSCAVVAAPLPKPPRSGAADGLRERRGSCQEPHRLPKPPAYDAAMSSRFNVYGKGGKTIAPLLSPRGRATLAPLLSPRGRATLAPLLSPRGRATLAPLISPRGRATLVLAERKSANSGTWSKNQKSKS
jgi:hypothetical protein